MRIALVHASVGGRAGGGGGVRQMLELALGLERQGHQVVVACRDFEPGSAFAEATDPLDIRALQTGRLERPVGERARLREFWRDMPRVARLVPRGVDVVNAHEWPAVRAGRLAAARLGVPFVWTRNDETLFERGAIPDETIVRARGPESRVVRVIVGLPDLLEARRAAEIVVLDSRNERMVRRAYRRRARIVRSGPRATFFDPPDRREARERLGIDPDTFLAIAVGILFPHRRFEDLVDAVSALPAERGIEALIVGSDHADPDYGARLADRVRTAGAGERVRLLRRSVSEAELRDVYAAGDAFVFPNQRQTWGLAPLEAIASGTPVIVSSGAGVHEVLAGRPGVAIVPPGRPDAIAAALGEMAERDARAELTPTREWVRSELTADRYAAAMAALFEEARGRTSERTRRCGRVAPRSGSDGSR